MENKKQRQEVFMEKETIFFISVIEALDSKATSTHIMTTNLLRGLKEAKKTVIFFAICESNESRKCILDYFSNLVDQIVLLHSNFYSNMNKYSRMTQILSRSLFSGFYKDETKKALQEVKVKPDLIVTHSPSFESLYYGKILRDIYKNVSYYQYWSDPLTLSGITPDKFSIKRLPYKWAEKRMLQYADRIIYGTKTLMQFQKCLFPVLSDKMRYIDIAYTEKEKYVGGRKKKSLLYAGNFYSDIRNINPLIEALKMLPEYTLDIYGEGDAQKNGASNNISFRGRVSPEELKEKEDELEYQICILNHSCIQIPGKIFYNMTSPCKILVILDGAQSNVIRDYLQTYHRFIFCKNNPNDIRKAIVESADTPVDIQYVKENYNAEKIALSLTMGGYGEDGRCDE